MPRGGGDAALFAGPAIEMDFPADDPAPCAADELPALAATIAAGLGLSGFSDADADAGGGEGLPAGMLAVARGRFDIIVEVWVCAVVVVARARRV